MAAVGLTGPAVADGAFTEAQAARGQQLYDVHCAGCHQMTLRGSAHGSELKGATFTTKWGARKQHGSASLQPRQHAARRQ